MLLLTPPSASLGGFSVAQRPETSSAKETGSLAVALPTEPKQIAGGFLPSEQKWLSWSTFAFW